MEADPNNPPYRATRLWNEVILAFRTGMPLKRHRYRIRHYSDSFTAADCISWLNCYLKNNPNFGPHVTRQQTMQLLQKFVKCHVIESAISKSGKIDFRDNTHLYKFVEYTPLNVEKKSPLQSLLRTPLSSRNANVPQHNDVSPLRLQFDNFVHPKSKCRDGPISRPKPMKSVQKSSIPECHIMERRLAVTEIENIWKTVTLNKLESLLSPAKSEELTDLTSISGNVIRHNCNKISKSGVVLLIDKTDDVPHWIISAMKCLANWPEASGSGSCLPNYPGFEKDVFRVVKDYFLNSQITLIPPHLQPLIGAAINKFMKIDIVVTGSSSSKREYSPSATIKNPNNQKTSTPLDNNKVLETIDPEISDLQTNIQSLEGQLILNDSEAMWENPLNTFYETEFYSVNPVTRIVSSESKESLLSLVSSNSLSYHSLDTMSTLSACSRMTKFSKYTKIGSQHRLDQSKDEIDELDKTLLTLDGSLEQDLNLTIDNKYTPKASIVVAKECGEFNQNPQSLNKFHSNLQNEIKQPTVLANDSLNLYSRNSLKSPSCDRNSNSSRCRTPSLCNIFEPHHYSNISVVSNKSTVQRSAQTSKAASSQMILNRCSPGNEEYQTLLSDLKESLQYIFLFLPVSNRRQLHLLFRMINKILKNNKLVLDATISTKDYLLETFLPAVMKFDDDSHVNMSYAYEILSFMVKECESLLRPSDALKEDVQMCITALQRQRIKYSGDDISFLTYCQLISKQQYEEQKLSGSKQALFDLLEAIVQDKRLSEKEKKKKLKQFQMSHPDIFQERFSSPEEVEFLFAKSRKPLLTRFLNLRM